MLFVVNSNPDNETCFVLFFCNQKTADEIRISDWSSDVCSSDLRGHDFALALVDESGDLLIGQLPHELYVFLEALGRDQRHQQGAMIGMRRRIQIGRASCRERVCQYVSLSEVDVS